ncbi:MAG: FlgD immunoglobulin-like domain containing protein [Candidatus Eisenbacteria bacterium]|uniref:T9SS type A sorting domain-containing protein n=1 Tax=Eiseniibacteriota bacterium TaxID=2212470 RepID=A0A956LWH8_UNCEI|nr:T9SS type A sorting domain-containing protein [Candidatus Eisenbacteria bacterium]
MRIDNHRRGTLMGGLIRGVCGSGLLGIAWAAVPAQAYQLVIDTAVSVAGPVSNASYLEDLTAGFALMGESSNPFYTESIGPWSIPLDDVSGIEVLPDGVPHAFGISQAGPNPFGSGTALELQIASSSAPQKTRLEIFDVQGRSIALLMDGAVAPGVYRVSWDRRNADGDRVTNGIYFARFQSGTYARTVRLVAAR